MFHSSLHVGYRQSSQTSHYIRWLIQKSTIFILFQDLKCYYKYMKFVLKGPLKDNINTLMRKIGYSFQGKDEKTGEMSCVCPPRGYPRIHLYLKVEGDDLIFNLHL